MDLFKFNSVSYRFFENSLHQFYFSYIFCSPIIFLYHILTGLNEYLYTVTFNCRFELLIFKRVVTGH